MYLSVTFTCAGPEHGTGLSDSLSRTNPFQRGRVKYLNTLKLWLSELCNTEEYTIFS